MDSSNNVVNDPATNASIRVTGYKDASGVVRGGLMRRDSTANPSVAGTCTAPEIVEVSPSKCQGVYQNDQTHYRPDGFPLPTDVGTFNSSNALILPPATGTWADHYYQAALGGGTVTSVTKNSTVTAPKVVQVSSLNTTFTIKGPGVVFVKGNVALSSTNKITNGSPPATLVVSGNFTTTGTSQYLYNPDTSDTGMVREPSLLVFGPLVQHNQTSTWKLNGLLAALNPNGKISLNGTASKRVFGALASNGDVIYESGNDYDWPYYPQSLKGMQFMISGLPMVVSYSVVDD